MLFFIPHEIRKVQIFGQIGIVQLNNPVIRGITPNGFSAHFHNLRQIPLIPALPPIQPDNFFTRQMRLLGRHLEMRIFAGKIIRQKNVPRLGRVFLLPVGSIKIDFIAPTSRQQRTVEHLERPLVCPEQPIIRKILHIPPYPSKGTRSKGR